MTEANVASLFKKGDTQNVANYRPISLLNTMYKLYAAIIQSRIEVQLDDQLQKMQFGFRRHRGTAQAIHCVRRAAEFGELTGNKMVMVLLDWEKAFDKVHQKRMIQALQRFGIPNKICDAIGSIYKEPKFKVQDRNSTSEEKKAKGGN